MMLGYDLPLLAGRELDALVAEKVMGFEWRDVRILGSTNTVRVLARPGTRDMDGCFDSANLSLPRHPAYSTEIASAWKVVEKMAAPGFKVWINCSGAGTFDVEVSVLGEDTKWHVIAEECDCETAPLAICLASLAAIGEVSS